MQGHLYPLHLKSHCLSVDRGIPLGNSIQSCQHWEQGELSFPRLSENFLVWNERTRTSAAFPSDSEADFPIKGLCWVTPPPVKTSWFSGEVEEREVRTHPANLLFHPFEAKVHVLGSLPVNKRATPERKRLFSSIPTSRGHGLFFFFLFLFLLQWGD